MSWLFFFTNHDKGTGILAVCSVWVFFCLVWFYFVLFYFVLIWSDPNDIKIVGIISDFHQWENFISDELSKSETQ